MNRGPFFAVALGICSLASAGLSNSASAIGLPDTSSCNTAGTACLFITNNGSSSWGIAGTGKTQGVVGQSSTGNGVVGLVPGGSGAGVVGSKSGGTGAGVRGTASAGVNANGVEGIVSNSVSAVYGENNTTGTGFGVAGRVKVAGTAYAVYGDSHFSQSAWAGFFDGSVNAEAYFTSSDARLKKDVSNLSYGLHEVLQMRPVSFNWKTSEQAGRLQLGLIAQELQALIPEVVRSDAKTENLGVNYTALVSVLIRSIQEQQTIIESQEARLARLEKKSAPVALGSLVDGGWGTGALVAAAALGLVAARSRRSSSKRV